MRLTLRKETLADLTPAELGSVVAGITTLQTRSVAHCPGLETVPTFPVLDCVLRG